ncbi:acyltransferase family protein [Paractinoplanes atraurantiacus]|uniref:Peptidoglycan/LPS O-acetylase OafA/YrhL, contains acyltransferase and SGNH-hydrolase domains n=1 Tax=Paractinoplanes atraurantiacus TaxID=1036182 RepID=A0A285IGZ1_9ACTN|nr:acyltransferase [Actinoplanes atraurantiacus]SNY47222.1 Peptidoglycan/LPS O-acetylase OafA/YrhL, contains acyltransferase and SGNH-hydrolase domains [Actinoplanes atraurantiacus]
MRQQHHKRIVVLDGLRLMAAVMVAFYHFAGRNDVVEAWGAPPRTAVTSVHSASAYGWLGVELFFMISGFVICMSAWGRDTGSFIRSRFIRLFPAYWPAVLITAAVVGLWPIVAQPLRLSDVLLNLTMLQWPLGVNGVEGVYWTLWVEARFYLLFALLLWRGLTLRGVMWFGYGWLLASVIAHNSREPLLNIVFQPDYAPLFVAGIAFYLIHRFGPDLKLWGLVAASYLMAQHNVIARIAHTEKTNIKGPLSDTVGILLITVFFALLAAVALGWTSRIRWRVLTTAGLLTYPFYLLHQNIGYLVIYATRDWAPHWLVLAGTVAFMLLIAWLVHRYIERPLAAYLRRRLNPRPAPETAVTQEIPHVMPHHYPGRHPDLNEPSLVTVPDGSRSAGG